MKSHTAVFLLLLAGCLTGPSLAARAEPSLAADREPTNESTAFRDCALCPAMTPFEIDGSAAPLSFSVYELTWQEYAFAVDVADCPFPNTPFSRDKLTEFTPKVRDTFPMTSLAPDQIGCYLDFLTEVSGHRYRLPTEAEWEAVAEQSYAGTIMMDRPKFEPNYIWDPRVAVQHRVIRRVGGQYHPATGLFDLFGNAREIVVSKKAEEGTVMVRGGYDEEKEDFDRIRDYKFVTSKSSGVTDGFRLVREDSSLSVTDRQTGIVPPPLRHLLSG